MSDAIVVGARWSSAITATLLGLWDCRVQVVEKRDVRVQLFFRTVAVFVLSLTIRCTLLFAQGETHYGIIASQNVMVLMRDGVRLATNIYRPGVNGVPAPGKFPVILERTPYNKERHGRACVRSRSTNRDTRRVPCTMAATASCRSSPRVL